MTNKLKQAEIPESHVDFAKEIASTAKKFGIDKFTLEYKPSYDHVTTNIKYYGTLKVHFSVKDGRGRPADNLRITYESYAEHVISETPESSN